MILSAIGKEKAPKSMRKRDHFMLILFMTRYYLLLWLLTYSPIKRFYDFKFITAQIFSSNKSFTVSGTKE